ncbi:MAG: hypothetical protein SFW08_13270 [Gemmatimonadaceae bacterium]|nr:hypothetical protein [Gemmatimonadaceae bacterium]
MFGVAHWSAGCAIGAALALAIAPHRTPAPLGELFTPHDHPSRVTVVAVVQAADCAGRLASLDAVAHSARTVGAHFTLAVLASALDTSRVAALTRDRGWNATVVSAPAGAARALRQLGIRASPALLVIDPDGAVRFAEPLPDTPTQLLRWRQLLPLVIDTAGNRAVAGTSVAASPPADDATSARQWRWRAAVTRRAGDDSLVSPVRLAAVGDSAFVLDAAHRAVFRLWWRTPNAPQLAPTALRGQAGTYVAASANGAVALLDHAQGRIVTARGAVRTYTPIAHLPSPFAVCPLAGGDAIVLTGGVDSALVRVTPQGTVVWARRWPWAERAESPALARQGMFAPTPQGSSCVLASVFGAGWAVVDADGHAVRTTSYRVAEGPPEVRRHAGAERLTSGVPAAGDVTVRGDTVEVLAVGRSVFAWQQIDRYALGSGQYLGSVRLRERVGGIAAAPGGWFTIVRGQRGTAIGWVGFR